jgi:hypothetical protein
LFQGLRRRTGQLAPALLGTAFFTIGTPVFGWSTSAFSHGDTASLLLLAFFALDVSGDEQRLLTRAILGGVCLGIAVMVEYTAAISAVIIGLGLLIVMMRKESWQKAVSFFAIAGAAGIACLLPVLIYNNAAFGSPFSLGYANLQGFEGMRQGIFGIGIPRPEVMLELIVNGRVGLLWVAPAIVVALAASVAVIRDAATRYIGVIALLLAAWYFLSNAGYFYWDGGYSAGPRHFTPGFALLGLTLGLGYCAMPSWARIATWALVGLSVAENLLLTATGMMIGPVETNIWDDHVLPELAAGKLDSTVSQLAFGGHSLAHLLLPLAIWALLVVMLRSQQSSQAAAQGAAG